MSIPASIAAESAIARQGVALSNIKTNAEATQQLAEVIQDSVVSAPVNSSRGSNINILV